MTPLVCVAPDGTLEVWERRDREYIISIDDFAMACMPRVIWDRNPEQIKFGPEYWGREVLGKL